MKFSSKDYEIRIMTLDPGHFHAALVQKTMYPQVSSDAFVYAPEGEDVELHMNRINAFNSRHENPTNWNVTLYTGDDFFKRMLEEKPGNVVVLSGNNAKKTEYILKAVQNGINVLSDKPMVITPETFPILEQAFEEADKRGVLLYDIMTERYEITTMLQKKLAHVTGIFGELKKGSIEEPAVTKESVHHFFKYVSGKPLIRPPWYFDVEQQGEGIVDVTTHLVDMIHWECFPGEIIDRKNIQMISAQRWPTKIDAGMFEKVTGMSSFPGYLSKDISNDTLFVYSNGAFIYTINGVFAKVSVIWNFEAPEGTGDTHYSIMRGTKANLVIKQGAEENFKPTLYVKAVDGQDIYQTLHQTVSEKWQEEFPGLSLSEVAVGTWKLDIPDTYKVGHEAHFAQVTEKYLSYLTTGKMQEWEVPNMITKYFITTEALKLARKLKN
ncbi:putative oxidoreductase C-terminal domain-containing protein [Bacteroidota bacterium]